MPCEIRELFRTRNREKKWLSSRFAVIVCATARKKDGSALKLKDVFPELGEDD